MTRDYTMTADLGPCRSHGLLLASGVTLDGNGKRISGPANGSDVYGVYLRGTTRGTVKNVVVTGFLRGIRLRLANGNSILNNETLRNGNFATRVGYGIDVAGGSENFFQGNRIHNNADEGIHFGTGSEDSTFIGNSVYNNYRENIYLVSSDNNTFTDNITWGGQDSVYVKDSTLNVFHGNTFQDTPVHVRGDSFENEFINNDFIRTGIHFQVYTKETPFRYPHDNIVRGGTITGAKTCVRFSSSWANVIVDTVLASCSTDLATAGTEAESRNTVINTLFSPSKIALDSNSWLSVGWYLNVQVRDTNARPLSGARVRAFDASNVLLFDVFTNSAGNIPTQDVLQYTRGASVQLHTPLLLETTKPGYNPDTRQIPFSGNTTVSVMLQATASIPLSLPRPSSQVSISP